MKSVAWPYAAAIEAVASMAAGSCRVGAAAFLMAEF
jgi:hypothetical protein